MPALGLAGWWNEPDYRHCYTAKLRGEFILSKLRGARHHGRVR
jgi:hypothetical protein